jgi:hypothetical protein
VPGATPSKLVFVFGKNGNAYFLNRTNLGGISAPLVEVDGGGGISVVIGAAATYQTLQATYVAFTYGSPVTPQSSTLVAYRVMAGNPPAVSSSWSAGMTGHGSPFVTSTDGTNHAIVWDIGSEGDQRLHGFNGDTGAVIFNGGGADELMSGLRRYNTGIAAHGRIYVAGDNQVYAFTVPVPPIILTKAVVFPNGAFQFGFTNTPGLNFTVYSTTNLSLSFTNWTRLGGVTEISPGQFQFTGAVTGDQERFYRVSSP